MIIGSFPTTRLRRNRSSAWLRDIIAEHHIGVNDLIWPLFVIEGEDLEQPIASMPGIYRYSIDRLLKVIGQAYELGIKAFALFPSVDNCLRNDFAEEAYNPDNLICRTIGEIKSRYPDVGIICDIALDPYTNHGHDGILSPRGDVDNDATIEILCRQAIVQAEAGCDIVAPSDMMDGRVGAIRQELDDAGMQHVGILAYAAKYASAFYGPFRDAVGSSGSLRGKSKATYQMDYRNASEALREVALDIAEGADIVMVKPAMAYLDIIKQVKSSFNIPVFAYHVSGEYSMLKAAAENGWIDFNSSVFESLIACKRAGASAILTYAAVEVAKQLCLE
jgi:porphobilinogen synthase